MNKYLIAIFLCLNWSLSLAATSNPRVLLQTDLGQIVIELFPREAPTTVRNFLEYVDNDFYTDTVFHRVVPGFVIQGGGFTPELVAKKPQAILANELVKREPAKSESSNGLKNDYEMVAMANTGVRTNEIKTETPQFFINLQSNPALNTNGQKPGYTVFGKVIEGMDVAEKISLKPRGMYEQFPESPNSAIRILKAERIDPNKTLSELKFSTNTQTEPSSITTNIYPARDIPASPSK
jgi:cyclophilin family peptidyl-prolyl cis-trans isomerase